MSNASTQLAASIMASGIPSTAWQMRIMAVSLMASTSFAAEDLCAVNLKTFENAKAQTPPEMADQVMESVTKAKADQAKGKGRRAVGDLPGNDKLRSEGKVDETVGKAKTAVGVAQKKVGAAIEHIGRAVKR